MWMCVFRYSGNAEPLYRKRNWRDHGGLANFLLTLYEELWPLFSWGRSWVKHQYAQRRDCEFLPRIRRWGKRAARPCMSASWRLLSVLKVFGALRRTPEVVIYTSLWIVLVFRWGSGGLCWLCIKITSLWIIFNFLIFSVLVQSLPEIPICSVTVRFIVPLTCG